MRYYFTLQYLHRARRFVQVSPGEENLVAMSYDVVPVSIFLLALIIFHL